jgi:hypothetical protein
MKPALIVHPGFNKCATTSIQTLFMREDHVMARRAGVVWLGTEFAPFNGMPPVMEIGYRPDEAVAHIGALALDPGQRHFLSAESLLGADKVWAALKDRFEIARIIMTIRLPLLQALSHFCFSSWMTMSLERAITHPSSGFGARNSFANQALLKLKRSYCPEVLLCPIEPDHLEERFCTQAFGVVPEGLAHHSKAVGVRNTSISPLFATALSEMLPKFADYTLQPSHRAGLARAVQLAKEPEEFAHHLPPALKDYLQDKDEMGQQTKGYDTLLAQYGVDAATRARCVEVTGRRLSALAAKKAAPGAMIQAARLFARQTLRAALPT